MNDEERLELKKVSKILLNMHELYQKYLYLCTFDDIEAEKERLRKIFNEKIV